MADEFPIKVTVEADDAGPAGQKAGKEFTAGVEQTAKPKITPTIDTTGITAGLKSATDKVMEATGKSFGDAIDRSIVGSARTFGRTIQEQVEQHLRQQAQFAAGAKPGQLGALAPPPPPPTTPPPPPAAPGIAQQLQPYLSGLEAITQLFRGAPMLSVAQMAGQAITQYQTMQALQRLAAPAAGGPPPPPPPPGGGGVPVPAAAGAAGAGALFARALPFLGAVGGAVGTATAAVELRNAIGGLGLETAKEVTQAKSLSAIMGVSIPQLAEWEVKFRSAGLSVEEVRGNMQRLAVRAKADMPEITKEVERFADKSALASIKVTEAELNAAKSQDARGAAVDRLKQAQGEQLKVQELGVDLMAQERRAADLGVSGARIAQLGAQMQARQAAIGVQLAPQEAALADIAGPLTVEGARLGRAGAGLALEEIQARIKARREGVAEDPQEREDRERRKEDLALRAAQNKVREADLNEKRAQLGEDRRQREQAAGLGPEAQAQQQALQAAQAQEMSDLHVQQAVTKRRAIELEHESNDIVDRKNKAERDRADAARGVIAADLEAQKSTIGIRDANREQEDVKYQDIEQAQKLIRGEKPPEGFDVRKIDQETLKKAFFREGGYEPGAIYSAMGKFFREQYGPGPATAQEIATVGTTTGLRGLTNVPGFIAALKAEKPTPEQQALIDEQIKLWNDEKQATATAIVKQNNLNKIREDQAAAARGEAAFKTTPDQLAAQSRDTVNLYKTQQFALEGLSTVGGLFDYIGRIPLGPKSKAEQAQELPPGKSALDLLGLGGIPGGVAQAIPGLGPAVTIMRALGLLGFTGPSGAGEFEQPKEITKLPSEEVTKPVTDAGQQAGAEITSAGQQAGTAITGAGTEVGSSITGAGTEASGAIKGAGEEIKSAGGEVAGALSSVAAAIGAIQIPSPQQAPGGGEATYVEEQAGGLISGPGSETSDSIPIMASRDEFMIKASTTRKLGVPFLNALNEGRIGFQAGGVIPNFQDTSTPSPYQSLADSFKREFDQDTMRELVRLGIIGGFQSGGFVRGFRDEDDPRKQALKHAQGVQERREAANEARKWAAWAIPIARQLQAEKAAKDAAKKAGKPEKPTGGGGGTGSILTTGAGMSLPGEPPTSEFYPFVRPPPKFVKAPETDPISGQMVDRETALKNLATLRSPRQFGREPGRVKVIEAPTAPGEFGKVVTPSGVQPPKDTGGMKIIQAPPATPPVLPPTTVIRPPEAPIAAAPSPPPATAGKLTDKQRKDIASEEAWWASQAKRGTFEKRITPGGSTIYTFVPEGAAKAAPSPAAPSPEVMAPPSLLDFPLPPTEIGPPISAIPTPPPSEAVKEEAPPSFPRGVPLPRSRPATADQPPIEDLFRGLQIPPPAKRPTMEDLPPNLREQLEQPTLTPEQKQFDPTLGPDPIRKPYEYPGKPGYPPEWYRRSTSIEDEESTSEYAAAGGLIGSLVRGFANGGLVTASVSAQGYTGGSAAVSHARVGDSVQGFHQLDLRTNVGNIPVAASSDTIEAIRRSALSGKLSQTGPRPTWYS